MSQIESPLAQARAFLEVADQFKLGDLPTEQSHPWTRDLSGWANEDLDTAFACFKRVDMAALDVVVDAGPQIEKMARAVAETLAAGGRIFMAGCGATGRLALTVESLCRSGWVAKPYQESVFGFMAGGDAALIRSLEGFEDRVDYGRRQLDELGFRDGDRLIGITEGGETPFVIAATERSTELSQSKAWFCFCNPEEDLKRTVQRSRDILEHSKVELLPLITGPMALSGSTRLQATTVQLVAVAMALRYFDAPSEITPALEALKEECASLDYRLMAPFTECESAIIKRGEHLLYQTEQFGLTVLTDTTERAPTFSLNPFENTSRSDQEPSAVYLSVETAENSELAWARILGRRPRTLEWDAVRHEAGFEYLLGYDISARAADHRAEGMGSSPHVFSIEEDASGLRLQLDNLELCIPAPRDLLIRNLYLKLLLNAHSTLVAGRLGRYEGNWMTWVKPSNRKLIDRAIRYIRQIQEQRGLPVPGYETVCLALFETRSNMQPESSIVLETLKLLEGKDCNVERC
ncbi:MAG: SIS domain-containing protein [Opitutales bacterium]